MARNRREADPSPDGLGVSYPHVSAWTKPMLDGWEIARKTDIVGDRGVFRLSTEDGRAVKVTWTASNKSSDNPQFKLSKPRIWDRYLWAVQFTIKPPPEEVFGALRDAPPMAKSQQEAGFVREAGVPVDSDPAHRAIAARFFSDTGILTPGASVGENAPAYHRARVSARTGMRLLLTHVCERLEPLPRRHLGDDPFPTNWLVWALVWSAMNGHPSLRDQAALAADECAKGCIPFAPSAATLGRFTTSFATTPYLNGLTYALASPIRRMHPTEILVVDGLGAGNKAQADYRLGLQRGHQSDRVVRWWQPVVMAHPRYGYVAAGTVTDSKVGEPNKAIEMVTALARYGDLDFILGDGVYSSAEVMSAIVNAGGTPVIPWDADSVNAIAIGKRHLFNKGGAGLVDSLYAMFERDRALFKRLTNWRSQIEGVISAMRRNTPGGMRIRCAKDAGPTNEFLAYCIRQNLWALYRASIVYGVDVDVFGVRFEETDDDDGGDAGTVAA